VAIVVAVVRTGSAACAAAPVQAAAASGKATFYAATGAGNCSFDAVSNPLVVALGPAEYRAGAACGGYLDVTGPRGSVRVKVVDQCPECPAGHIDLSREAFAKIGNPVDGIVPVTYRTVANPAVPGPLTVRVKEGSSQFWLALRFDNHGNALTSAEIKVGNGFQRLVHTDYNYWLDENGSGNGPFTVRLTDSAGHQTTVPGVRLAVATVQRTGVPMYSGAAAAQPASATPARAAASSPSPSATVTAGTPTTSPPAAENPAGAAPTATPVNAGCKT
jgi:expansin (peptidoglycan-binding protein)